MKTITKNGITVTIPGEYNGLSGIVWLDDNNVVQITSTSAPIKCTIKLGRSLIGLNNLTTNEYYSSVKTIRFNLNDNLKFLWDDMSFNLLYLNISVEKGGVVTEFNARLSVYEGKSFIDKSHGGDEVIYIYNTDEMNVKIYSPVIGEMVIGNTTSTLLSGINTFDVSTLLTNPGEYEISMRSALNYPPIANILGDEALTPTSSKIIFEAVEQSDPGTKYGGSLWDKKQIFPKTYKIIYQEPCDDFPFVEIRYVNTDGCMRYIGGKLLATENAFEPTSVVYSGRYNEYRYSPEFINNKNSKVLKIGIDGILPGAEIEDIIYSNKVDIRGIDGNWHSCCLRTNTIQNNKNSGFDNFELEIIVSEL